MEVRRTFDFHPNEPKWYKYLTYKARNKKKRIFKFSAVTKVGKFISGFNVFKVEGFNGFSTNDSFSAKRT
jgi:hypothetical protein